MTEGERTKELQKFQKKLIFTNLSPGLASSTARTAKPSSEGAEEVRCIFYNCSNELKNVDKTAVKMYHITNTLKE